MVGGGPGHLSKWSNSRDIDYIVLIVGGGRWMVVCKVMSDPTYVRFGSVVKIWYNFGWNAKYLKQLRTVDIYWVVSQNNALLMKYI